MQAKTYAVICPVCRVEHVIQANFLSSPRSFTADDGRSLPSTSCGAHTAEELREIWNNRFKAEKKAA